MNIRKSVDAIMESGEGFGAIFYDIFFGRCPAAASYFDKTDMARQSVILTMALKLMEQFHANGFKAVEQYLQHIGTRHNDIAIPKEMYPDWRDSMLIALEKFHGDDWNDDLASDWHLAIDKTIEAMLNGYERRRSV